jgi:hypothetical protein
MSDVLMGAIVRTWARQREYAARLTDDLSDTDILSQPVPGVVMNHPAWVFGHLSAYSPVLAAIPRGQRFSDQLEHRYGRGSRPLSNAADYPAKDEFLAAYFRGHDELEGELARSDLAVLGLKIPLARWEARFPLIGARAFI